MKKNLLIFAIAMLLIKPSFAQSCSSMPGGDIGAKINAMIASTPNGGIVDCTQGFADTEILTTPVLVGGNGKAVNLKLNRGTTIRASTGSSPAFTVPPLADDSSIEGLVLEGSETQVGIYIHGSWYVSVRDSHLWGFSTAGIRVTDEQRGTYMWSLTNVVSGDPPGLGGAGGAPSNNINLLVENTSGAGVTFGIMNNFWSTYASGDGIVIRNISGGQAVGTMLNGGGSSYNGGNGIVLQAAPQSGMDINIQSFDLEFNGGDAVVDNENVFAVHGTNVFFSNNGHKGRNYVAHAESVNITSSGEQFFNSKSSTNVPAKNVMTIGGPNEFQSGVDQPLPAFNFRLQGVGDLHFEAIKTSFDQVVMRYKNQQSGRWFGWDALLNRLIFDNQQFWNPGSQGSITFPSQDTTLVGTDTTDELSNKTLVSPNLKVSVDTSTTLPAKPSGFITVNVNGKSVKVPYY
jgi:hypothetical protein